MNIFGLTPIDTALTVAGLNIAQLMMLFLFKHNGIVVIVGIIASLFVLLRLAINGQYSQVIAFVVSLFTAIVLLLPFQELNEYSSIYESQSNTFNSSKQLKERCVGYNRVPAIFTYLSHNVDLISFGLIKNVDNYLPPSARFMPTIYQGYVTCTYFHQLFKLGISDPSLRQSFALFIKEHYLSAIARLRLINQQLTLTDAKPTDIKIENLYSNAEKATWADLKKKIYLYFDNNQHLNQEARAPVASLMQLSDDALKKQMIMSLALHVIMDSDRNTSIIHESIGYALKAIPFLLGLGQMLVAIIFPFIIVAFLITRDVIVLKSYFLNFIWIKSWVLSIALSFYISVFIAHVESVAFKGLSWAWEYPYFIVGFIVSLVVLIVLTRRMIVNGG